MAYAFTLSVENQKLMELYNKQTEDKDDEYITFITNMRFPQLDEHPEQVAELYLFT